MKNLKSTYKEIRTDIKNWWILMVLGILFVVLGIFVFTNPLESYMTIAVFFAVSMLISGLFQKWFAISNRDELIGWGWQLALGIMEAIIGIVLLFNLNFTMSVLPIYVGFWLLFKAFALIGFSFELKSYKVSNWWYYLVFGLFLTILSWFIILNPLFGGITIVVWTGIALIVAGIAYTILSVKLKKVNRKIVMIKDSLSKNIE